jgi:transcriptional regulator with XRE-family HTH domain
VSGGGPTVARLQLGAQLRALRHAAGLDGEHAAERIFGSAAKISRLESGQLPVKPDDLEELLDLYRVEGETRTGMLELASRSRQAGWWDNFGGQLPARIRYILSLESEATTIMIYESHAVPALLQTSEYARAAARGHDLNDLRWRGGLTLNTLAHRRAARREDSPPRLWVILHEGALRRPPQRDIAIARDQLAALATIAQQDDVALQILPEAASNAVLAPGPFSILRFAPPDVKDTVMLEELRDIRTLSGPGELDAYLLVWSMLTMQATHAKQTLDRIAAADRWYAQFAAKEEETATPREVR